MKVFVTPIGSAGDNYPLIGIGAELSRRGHEVVVITNDHFAPVVRSQGLGLISIGTEEEYRSVMVNPDLWHPTRGFKTVMSLVSQHLRRLFDALHREIVPGQTLIVAPSLDLASRSIADKMDVPVVTIHLQPSILRTLHDMGVMTGTINWSFLPRWLKRLMWHCVDRWMIDPALSPTVNDIRRELGLPPVKALFADYLHSPLLAVGMFPEWYAPRQPDWPKQLRQTGFPLFDITGEDVSAVDDYLAAGEPPIVFTPGSANVHGRAFFAAACEACEHLGRRGLLLTRYAEQLPASLPKNVRHFEFAPLSRILFRCAALVHHGGIGTTAAALAAGVPQVIMPLAHDQPDNAHRVLKLGAGERILPRKFTGPRLAMTLKEILASDQIGRNCAEVAQRIAAIDAISDTCDWIEQAATPKSHTGLAHGVI